VFELRASEQEPLRVFVAFGITSLSRLEVIYDWYGILGLLLGTLLLVVLNNFISQLDLLLVGFNLLRGEHVLAHDCH
jgi:hypothetical protein